MDRSILSELYDIIEHFIDYIIWEYNTINITYAMFAHNLWLAIAVIWLFIVLYAHAIDSSDLFYLAMGSLLSALTAGAISYHTDDLIK